MYDTLQRLASHDPFTFMTLYPDVHQGAVHSTMSRFYPEITQDALTALRLCQQLESFTWMDDSFSLSGGRILLYFLDVIRTLPLKELTIRSSCDLGEDAWIQLNKLTGLRKVVIWCMDGPPRVLQGWAENLGETLTHLNLGVSSPLLWSNGLLICIISTLQRCAGVPTTILISVLSQLPHLRELRLKGAPSTAIPTLLTYLPNLVTLDTEYLGSGNYGRPNKPLPHLKAVIIRAMSLDMFGPLQLWTWIKELLPKPSLESFTLNAFSVQGHTSIPRKFILDLADIHGGHLKQFMVGSTQLTLDDIRCLCAMFPVLEDIVCSVASPDAVRSILPRDEYVGSVTFVVRRLPLKMLSQMLSVSVR
jgi:hypothetical protein